MEVGKFDVILRSIAGIPLAFYGYALQKAWISIESVPSSALTSPVDFLPGGITNAILAFAIGFLALRFDSHRFRHGMLWIGLGMQLATVLLFAISLNTGFHPAAFDIAIALADTGGVVLLSALWIDLYSLLNPVRVAYLNAITIIVAQALIFVIEGNELWRILPTLAVNSLLGVVLYILAAKRGENEHPPAPVSKAKFLFPYKAVLFIAVYSFAYGIASQSVSVVVARYTAVLPAIIVLLFIFLNTKRFNISMLLRLAFPLMVAGFLLVALIPGDVHRISSIMLYCGFSSMEMLLLLMVCTIAYSSRHLCHLAFRGAGRNAVSHARPRRHVRRVRLRDVRVVGVHRRQRFRYRPGDSREPHADV